MCRMQSLETNRLSTAPMSIVYSFLDEASSMITVCKQTVPMIDPLLLFFFSHWRFICVFYVFPIITVFNRVKLHFSAVFTVINFISMATTTKRKSNFGRIITENKPILMMMESVKFFSYCSASKVSAFLSMRFTYLLIIFTCYFYHRSMISIRFCFLNRRPIDRRAHLFFEPFFLCSSISMIGLSITTIKLIETIPSLNFLFLFSYQILFRSLNALNWIWYYFETE